MIVVYDSYLIFEIHVGRAQAHKTRIWWAMPTLRVYFSRYKRTDSYITFHVFAPSYSILRIYAPNQEE